MTAHGQNARAWSFYISDERAHPDVKSQRRAFELQPSPAVLRRGAAVENYSPRPLGSLCGDYVLSGPR